VRERGVDTVSNSAQIGDRVRAARIRLGLTQEQLAGRAGFANHQTVSQVELGQRDVKALELMRVAKALHLSMTDLLAEAEPQQALVLWRERPQVDSELKEAKFLEVWQRYKTVRSAVRQSTEFARIPTDQVDLATLDYIGVARMADQLRKLLDLGSCPAASLQEVLESRFGVLVWHDDLGQDGSAACTRDDVGAAVFINSREAPWRRNYDLAHELFHLVTWESTDVSAFQEDAGFRSQVEKYANAFASNLLLPAEAVIQEFDARCIENRIKWADLISIAREFHVSTEALLWRLVNLGRMNRERVKTLLQDDEFRTQDKAYRRGSWSAPPPFPENYVLAGFLAYSQGIMSRTRLSGYLDTSLVDLESVLEQYGLTEGDYYSNVVCTC